MSSRAWVLNSVCAIIFHSINYSSAPTMASQFPTLTFDEAKIALDEVIASFEEPEAKAKV